MCLSRLSVLIACKMCIFVFFLLCFSVFHYLFIRVMFATFCVYGTSCTIFTALHGMQTQSSDENSVCPTVRHTRGL